MEYKIKTGSFTYKLLVSLEKATDTAVAVVDLFDNPGKYLYGSYPKEINKNVLYQSVRQLKKEGLIETQKEGKNILVKITARGKDRAILYKLLENKSWDGKWRIVIFDIPETHRKIRRALREKLREWQFTPIQKSVWVSKIDVVEELKKYTREIGVENWVQTFEANKM